MLPDLLVLVASLGLLGIAADRFVDASSSIARRFKVSELFIGLTLVALGTSLPEISIAITGALKGAPAIAISNIIGSAIFNITLIVGLIAWHVKVHSNKQIVFRDCLAMLFVYVLLFYFLAFHSMGFVAGVVLLLFYAVYSFFLCKWRKGTSKGEKIKHDWAIALLGLAGIYIGSVFAVDSAVALGLALSIPQWVIGATVIAVGSSLPELVVSLNALKKGRITMGLGNVIGSNTIDIVGLGIAGMITPIAISITSIVWDMFFLFLSGIALTIMALHKYKITRKKGVVLMLIYASYIIYLVLPHVM